MPTDRAERQRDRICWVGRNGIAGVTLHVTVIATSSIRGCSSGLESTNNHEKRSISRKKQSYRILLVGNLEKLAKNRQVGIICHINVKRNQETGNRQTNRQSTVTLVRMRRALTRWPHHKTKYKGTFRQRQHDYIIMATQKQDFTHTCLYM